MDLADLSLQSDLSAVRTPPLTAGRRSQSSRQRRCAVVSPVSIHYDDPLRSSSSGSGTLSSHRQPPADAETVRIAQGYIGCQSSISHSQAYDTIRDERYTNIVTLNGAESTGTAGKIIRCPRSNGQQLSCILSRYYFALTTIFNRRCYAERGYATARRLSVCLSVRDVHVP